MIEVFFRTIKQTLKKTKLLSAAPEQARLELHWAMLGVWIVGFLAIKETLAAGKDPLRLSMALALRAVRRAAHTHANGCADLPTKLGHAARDGYKRTGSKCSRAWPILKTTKPPGPPNIQQATQAEVQLAQEFHGKSKAA